MQFNSKISFVGFLVAVSTLSASAVQAKSTSIPQAETEKAPLSIESRISRITKAIKQRDIQQPETLETEQLMAGWLNSRKGGWINTRGGGWIDGRRGSWADGRRGGFLNNRRWSDGGRFYRHRRSR